MLSSLKYTALVFCRPGLENLKISCLLVVVRESFGCAWDLGFVRIFLCHFCNLLIFLVKLSPALPVDVGLRLNHVNLYVPCMIVSPIFQLLFQTNQLYFLLHS